MFNRACNRESNFELLRIVCMVGIICHHFVGFHMDNSLFNTTTYYLANLFFPAGKIGFVAFLALSSWFLVNSKFKTKQFISLYFELFFYNVIFASLGVLITKRQLDVQTWLSLFVPISGTRSGFLTTYLFFYLFTPFLLIIIDKINKKQHILLLVILFWTQVLSYILKVIFNASWLTQHIPSTLTLFVFIYFLISFIKKYITITNKLRLLCFFIFLFSYSFAYALKINAFNTKEGTFIHDFLSSLQGMEYNVLNVMGGVCFFILFNFKMKKSKIINICAIPALGVLLAHETIVFKDVLFNNIIKSNNYCNSNGWIMLIVPAFAISIYIVFGIIDILRKYFIEQNIFKIKFLNNFCIKIDNLINQNTNN